jgi:Fic family protein
MAYDPLYKVTPHLLTLIEEITLLKAKIDISPISVSWVPRLTKEAFNKMSHSSTAIEGNPLTLKEVEILVDGGSIPQTPVKYVREIFNYLAALRYISNGSDTATIGHKDIFTLHKLIGETVLDRGPVGAYRNYQVYVGNHRPPKAARVPILMSELLEWLNGKGKGLPAVLTSAILHYQFEHIHPFGDGNGRVGRLLATWELFRRKFDTRHIFSVDEVYWENRQRYYAAIDNVRTRDGDLTGWLEFVAEAVQYTLEKVWMRIEAVKTQEDIPLELSPKQERLLRLLRVSSMSIQEIQDALGVKKAGAHLILRPLKEANLVKRVGGHKTGKYILA